MSDNIIKTNKITNENRDRNFLTQDMLGPAATLFKYNKINNIPMNMGNFSVISTSGVWLHLFVQAFKN
jgi:hypothetical protein